MSNSIESGKGVSVKFYGFFGGPGIRVISDCLWSIKKIMRALEEGIYGSAINTMHIELYVDGAVRKFDFEGPTGVRYFTKTGELTVKVGIRESMSMEADAQVVRERFGNEMRKTFECLLARIEKAKVDFYAEEFRKDVDELLRLFTIVPYDGSREDGSYRLFKNYLLKRRLANALEEPIASLGWRPGYDMCLDADVPGGIRFIVPDVPAPDH